MKITVRAFSLGLLTASVILFIMYFITDDSSQAVEELTVEQLAEALEEKGYRTITEDEYISFSVYQDEKKIAEKESEKNNKQTDKTDTNDKKVNEDAGNKEEKEKEEENEKEQPKEIKVKVESGFVSKDIAEILKDEGIIDETSKFVKYMEDNGYSPYIQIGTFTVHSEMSLKELAETFTTYPGN
ncbi:MAG: endolytic transglycosylase MltG [Bacilli bacterium]|nr:endolytic transglycosylase MltG [Bacilli bacterium]